MSRLVLGLNTHHGDASAVLAGPKGPIAAIAQERIDRVKHSANFPADAIREVLRIAGADISDVTDIAVARDPNANLPQKLAYVARHGVSGLEMARRRLAVHRKVRSTAQEIADAMGIDEARIRADFHQVEHHLAHVASAFYWSPFERCAAFTCDGAGDFASNMFARCEGRRIEVLGRTYWPHSLGVFYSAMTQFLGFDRYGEEYKVMGLSAYGRDRYGRVMRSLVHYAPGRGIRLNLDYFVHHEIREAFETIEDGQVRLPRLYGPKLEKVLGPARLRGTELTEREKDLAMSMQKRHEEVFLDALSELLDRTGARDVVLAGGSVLNSVANGRMITEGYVERAYFQPAASDDGTAAGAASYVLHAVHGVPRHDPVTHAYWGTEWSDEAIEKAIEANGR
ncbi:MAG: carbamoyltransferase, partial [Deltaproteobacteria bacterium]